MTVLSKRIAIFPAMVLLALFAAGTALANPGLPLVWPPVDRSSGVVTSDVTLPSTTPFSLSDFGDPGDAPAVELRLRLYLPPQASAGNPVPAVVLLHGASGVVSTRGPTYAHQLAQMGVAAVVVDSFG